MQVSGRYVGHRDFRRAKSDKTMNNDLDPVQSASQQQFDRQSKRYGKRHILADTSDVADLIARVPPLATRRALDVAAGAGHTGLYLAAKGWQVTLADISMSMLKRASELAEERGLKVEVRQHVAESFPYGDQSFDLVTCRVAPHHFSDPAAFVRESARVLTPDGSLAVIDGTVADGEAEAEEWLHHLEKLRDPSHHRYVTPDQWRAMCKQAGLSVVHCELRPMLQPDLDWYFYTAGTKPENREAVLQLIETAPESARRLFQLRDERAAGGKVTWYWQRMSLLAVKGGTEEEP
jgi:ubiquinone/menaquinone biosynthesis C-methylase UbiE